jgi:hypothetical protein
MYRLLHIPTGKYIIQLISDQTISPTYWFDGDCAEWEELGDTIVTDFDRKTFKFDYHFKNDMEVDLGYKPLKHEFQWVET